MSAKRSVGVEKTMLIKGEGNLTPGLSIRARSALMTTSRNQELKHPV